MVRVWVSSSCIDTIILEKSELTSSSCSSRPRRIVWLESCTWIPLWKLVNIRLFSFVPSHCSKANNIYKVFQLRCYKGLLSRWWMLCDNSPSPLESLPLRCREEEVSKHTNSFPLQCDSAPTTCVLSPLHHRNLPPCIVTIVVTWSNSATATHTCQPEIWTPRSTN